MVAVDDDEGVARLFQLVGRDDLGEDERFATGASRHEHRAALECELSAAFGTRTAPEWEQLIIAARLGCSVADGASHFAFCYEDPQAIASNMMVTTSHPSLGGNYWRYSPVLDLSDTPSQVLPFCDLGEHSLALLLELGYAEDRANELIGRGVVVGSKD
jgi:crotonobetainyl-CoA:carnitine CoA-transferase CaiB-like acyl-CoA transferase